MKITIEQIPDTFEKFEEMADTQRTPELVCVLFLCALALFIRNREDGIAAMNLLRGPRPHAAHGQSVPAGSSAGKGLSSLCLLRRGFAPE